jgi:hypothetical protein
MSTADGFVGATTKIVDHGDDALRYNIVILGDGYRTAEMAKFRTDVKAFVDALHTTAPFGDLWCGINVHRVDVVSTDSGADDPVACADGSVGTGAAPKTYFDSTFCGGGSIRRLLTCNAVSAKNVAKAQVPAVHMTMVIVNTPQYGGSGGMVATFSINASATEIALHEMGHTAFALADEYEYYAGCGTGEGGHDVYSGGEPIEPNVTANPNKTTLKWKAVLSGPADPLPTTVNANCAQCDPQPNPKAAGYVGAYAGARYFHCGAYRGGYNCRMRALGNPYCAVCQKAIRDTLAPYLPAAYQGLWWNAPAGSESGWGIGLAHQEDLIFATWFTYNAAGKPWWLVMTAAKTANANVYTGTLLETRGPAFNAAPFNPALVTSTSVGTGTLTFTDNDNAAFDYTVNGLSRSKTITRQKFATPVPTCTFGTQGSLAAAINYQDLWWNAPGGSESGWGLSLAHQGDIIFGTWFTYDLAGVPLWMVVTAMLSAPKTYGGTLYTTTGPAFGAVPFDPAGVALAAVGNATLTFADGNHGAFAYAVNGISQTKQITRQVFRPPGTTCR